MFCMNPELIKEQIRFEKASKGVIYLQEDSSSKLNMGDVNFHRDNDLVDKVKDLKEAWTVEKEKREEMTKVLAA